VFGKAFGAGGANALAFLNLGLSVFFVLSGYLIARPFVRAFIAGERAPAFRSYARNRLLRIVPAFWIVFTILLIRHGSSGSSPGEVASIYLFAQNYDNSPAAFMVGSAWTLSVEMGFYVLVPLAALGGTLLASRLKRLGDPRSRLALVVGVVLVVSLASLVYRGLDPTSGSHVKNLPSNLAAFAPGILLAAFEIEAAPRLAGTRAGRILAVALLGMAALLLGVFTQLRVESEVWRAFFAAAGAGALVAAPLVRQWATGSCWGWLDNRPLRWLGERSYSVYLVHVGVLIELRSLARSASRADVGLFLLMAAGLPLTIVVAHVSHRFFEVPFLRRRRAWRPPPGRAVVADARRKARKSSRSPHG
jgi:peptidoglycan/LPS O-acetylase OafA/YrhL